MQRLSESKNCQGTSHKHHKVWIEMMWLKHDFHFLTWCWSATNKYQNWTILNDIQTVLTLERLPFFLKHLEKHAFSGGYLHNMHQHKCPWSPLLLPHFLSMLVKETCNKSEKAACIFPRAQSACAWPCACSFGWLESYAWPYAKFPYLLWGPKTICIPNLQMLCIFEYTAGVPLVPNNKS